MDFFKRSSKNSNSEVQQSIKEYLKQLSEESLLERENPCYSSEVDEDVGPVHFTRGMLLPEGIMLIFS